MMAKRVLIIGGVAGGASCAARLRRLSEEAEIVVFDRGPYVSFANCGLPYYVGDIIKEESSLLVASADLFHQRFNIDVRTENEVIAIDSAQRQITVRDLRADRLYSECYDELVLAPGAAPIRPPLPGIDLAGVFSLRTIPDSRRIRRWIEEHNARRAVVVGAGFVGLEIAENLVHRGLEVSLIEMGDHVLPPLDAEMAVPLHEHLRAQGIKLFLGDGVAAFAEGADGLEVSTQSGAKHLADLVILGIGVRPETRLAEMAGLKLGRRNGIAVDEQMRTSDPHIWAVGDAVEVRDFVTGEQCLIPLAGPANRQGRIAADAICGRASRFRGVQATAVCGLFDMVAAASGASEKTLVRLGIPYEKIYLYPGHHVGYYPNARPIDMKLLFDPQDGRILGIQAVGEAGVEKRVDVIATAIQQGSTVFDLEEVELCYAPQFGAAKDPVNIAGMIAANALRGDAPLAHWDRIDAAKVVVLDVRDEDEFADGHVPGACNIPLGQLRERMGELAREQPVYIYCQVGQRAYYATRALRLNGYDAYNLSGGFNTYQRMVNSGANPTMS